METVLNAITRKKASAIEIWEKLVNIDSGIDNPVGIQQVAYSVGEKLRELGFTISYLEYPGNAPTFLHASKELQARI